MTSTINASLSAGIVTTADTSGVLALQTAGTTAVTVDASQNVGIGTASPSGRLNLAVGASTSCTLRLTANNTGTGAGDRGRLDFYSADNSGTAYQLGYMDYDRSDGTGTASYIAWANRVSGTVAERMRIDSSGNVGIGTTSISNKLEVNGTINIANGSSVGWGNQQTTITGSTATNVMQFYTAAVERMRIDGSGNLLLNTTSTNNNEKMRIKNGNDSRAIAFQSASAAECGYIYINAGGTGTTYSTSSDYRLKEDIAPMTGALAKVAQLKPVTYKWKINGSYGQGFIAHELAEVVPDCVTGEKDAVETYTDKDGNEATRPVYQGIDTSFLVATLTAAIQELKALTDTQASTITALTARITALERP